MASVYETLSTVDLGNHIEKKGNLAYVSWAWAWATVKKFYPEAFYTIYENSAGLNYHTDGSTAWVKTGVTIEGLEHIEYLPIMDQRNRSIPLANITSFDVNKAIQRSLTKACARHGLGLYIYAGEDLPEERPMNADERAEIVASIVSRAAEKGYSDKINETAYKGRSWDNLTDEELKYLDAWLDG